MSLRAAMPGRWATVIGVFLRPRQTFEQWRRADPPTATLFFGFTLPLLMISVALSGVAHESIPSAFPAETRPQPFPFALYSLLTQSVGLLALAAAAHYLCDLFQGYSDFHRHLAAVSVALLPAWIGNVVAALPWPIGAYLALGLILYSLVLLYPAFAVICGIERKNRLSHLSAALLAALLVTAAFAWQAMSLIPGAAPEVRLGTTWLI